MPRNSNDGGPEGPDFTPNMGCAVRPTLFVLDHNRAKILAAARDGRDRRSIAAQYGLNQDELFTVVAQTLRKAA